MTKQIVIKLDYFRIYDLWAASRQGNQTLVEAFGHGASTDIRIRKRRSHLELTVREE
jgi:hypothetical protein